MNLMNGLMNDVKFKITSTSSNTLKNMIKDTMRNIQNQNIHYRMPKSVNGILEY